MLLFRNTSTRKNKNHNTNLIIISNIHTQDGQDVNHIQFLRRYNVAKIQLKYYQLLLENMWTKLLTCEKFPKTIEMLLRAAYAQALLNSVEYLWNIVETLLKTVATNQISYE